MMKKPNFYILGAPKCGTTSLAKWLSEHPQVFFSGKKEPNFFNTDMKPEWGHITKAVDYEALFLEANDNHIAVGEGTVWYFLSRNAVLNILDYSPDAKFIVMLRNPIDMIVSLHEELVHAGIQSVPDFEKALNAQGNFKKEQISKEMPLDRRNLNYLECCSLGEQLRRLLELVDKERIHIIWMDDLNKDASVIFDEVCEFLGILKGQRSVFNAENKGRSVRSSLIKLVLRKLVLAKRNLGLHFSFGIGMKVQNMNTVEQKRQAMNPNLRNYLAEKFESDWETLTDLTGCDRKL